MHCRMLSVTFMRYLCLLRQITSQRFQIKVFMLTMFRWKKLSLVKKMVAGFCAMAFISFTALAISFTGLYTSHKTANVIARHDLVLIIHSDALRDLLQDQDAFADKFTSSNDPQLFKQFSASEALFRNTLTRIKPDMLSPDSAHIPSRYDLYCKQAYRLFRGDKGADKDVRNVSKLLSEDLVRFEAQQRKLVEERLDTASRKEKQTIVITLALTLTGFLLAGIVASLVTINVSRSMDKLKRATTRIAEGDFDFDHRISEGDEIGDLAQGFTRMAARLKELEQHSLDASPLTRLPGNIAIERALNRKLQSGERFAFCYADLDNLKAYNDCYGYLKASEVIKLTGQIINDTVRERGCGADFVGHVGGDDFVMVVALENAEMFCQTIIERFSSMIVQNYSSKDLAAGCIQGIDRYGMLREFPIMTISIAVLMCGHGEYETAMEIAKVAAEIKDHVKDLPGSNYLVNRRKIDGEVAGNTEHGLQRGTHQVS
jgi:diguanylate cyclase (GGDEF)-like protein